MRGDGARSSAPGSPGTYLSTCAKISPAIIIALTMMITARGVQSRWRKRMDRLLFYFSSCSLKVLASHEADRSRIEPLRSCGHRVFGRPCRVPPITVLTVDDRL